MPAPTNISFATATDLGTLPATVTQQVDDAGTTYTVYYKFTAPSSAVVIGAWGFGDLATYMPTMTPYDGPASSPTQILGISVLNVPMSFPVVGGQDYFLKIQPNGGNPTPATLTLSVQVAPHTDVPIGSIAVNDAAGGFPLGYFSSTTNYETFRFQNDFPEGEAGDTSLDGYVLVQDASSDELVLYQPTSTALEELARIASGTGTIAIRLCQGLNTFYISRNQNPATFRTMTTDGAISNATSMTGSTSCGSIAASNDGALVYHAANGTNAAIDVWDVVNGMALANLVAGIANYVVADILVLTDDTILVGYSKSSATRDYKVLAYNAAGSTLHTYSIGQWETSVNRLAYALDDPASFWVMHHPVGADDGKILFYNLRVSDGAILSAISTVGYTNGGYDAPASAMPLARFGPSSSCPFWLTRSAFAPGTTTFTIRRLRRFLLPSSPDNKSLQIPTLELLMRTGIGLTPGDEADPPVLGSDPQVMLRISKDGGKTYGAERWISAGALGRYKDRVRWTRATGNYRNAVCEIVVSDPVDWQFLAMLGSPQEGIS